MCVCVYARVPAGPGGESPSLLAIYSHFVLFDIIKHSSAFLIKLTRKNKLCDSKTQENQQWTSPTVGYTVAPSR